MNKWNYRYFRLAQETGKLALEMFEEAGIICEFVERT